MNMNDLKPFFESDREIYYWGVYRDIGYEVRVSKETGQGNLIISRDALMHDNYKIICAEMYKAVVKNLRQLKGLSFSFLVTNEVERARSEDTIHDLEIGSQAKIIDESKQKLQVENYFKANIIEKEEQGKKVSYFTRTGDSGTNEYILEGVSYKELEEELERLEVSKRNDIENKTPEMVANMVLDNISRKRRQYYLESALNYSAKNEYEQASLDVTSKDDKVNTEIGIVKKDPYVDSENTYRAIERNGGEYRVANPSVNEISSIPKENQNLEITSEELETREEENVYYIDYSNYDIYNKEFQKIGSINAGSGYQINVDNNHLLKDGKDIGSISDINDLGVEFKRDKPKARTLEKQDNKGFIATSMFLIILSVMTLLGMVVYLIGR